MKTKLSLSIILSASLLLLISWGKKGHEKINESAALSFVQQMNQFLPWASDLGSHASDADYRKGTDPDESRRHYINIENYPDFNSTGRIPQTLDSLLDLYGQNFVYDIGLLPFSTQATFDTLKACFERLDWEKAMLTAADLGHYVGDAFNPLHVTRNYDGQLSGNNGVHSRYETSMINARISEIIYEGDSLIEIMDVSQFVFDYIYKNQSYVDTVLLADDYAKSLSSNVYNSVYYDALWGKTKGFTINQFKKASHSLAQLIFTAWVQAGSPDMSTFVPAAIISETKQILEVYPNPFHSTTQVILDLESQQEINLQIRDIVGKTRQVIYTGLSPKRKKTFNIKFEDLPSGIYFLVLKTENQFLVQKMIHYK